MKNYPRAAPVDDCVSKVALTPSYETFHINRTSNFLRTKRAIEIFSSVDETS